MGCAARCVDHNDEINRALNGSWGCQGLMLHVQSLYRDGKATHAWPCNQFLDAVHRANGIRTEAYCPLSCEIWRFSSSITSTSTIKVTMTTDDLATTILETTTLPMISTNRSIAVTSAVSKEKPLTVQTTTIIVLLIAFVRRRH